VIQQRFDESEITSLPASLSRGSSGSISLYFIIMVNLSLIPATHFRLANPPLQHLL